MECWGNPPESGGVMGRSGFFGGAKLRLGKSPAATGSPRGLAMTPERLLELLLRPVPATRETWKSALRAELAGLDDPRARWSFARGCWPLPLRYALSGPRRVGLLVFATASAAMVFDWQVNRDGPAAWLCTPLLVWYVGLLLAGTARRSPLTRRTVATGGATALATTAAALAMTLLAPASSWEFPVAVAAVAALVAASFAVREQRHVACRGRGDAAALAAGEPRLAAARDAGDPVAGETRPMGAREAGDSAAGEPRSAVARQAGAFVAMAGGSGPMGARPAVAGQGRQRVGAALWAAGGVALLLPVAAFAALDLSPLWGGGGVPANGLGAEPPEARDAYAGLLLVAAAAAVALTVITKRRSPRRSSSR
ncbi:hypothetical protein [Dactylosporangium sp. CA-139066]|uniref:hypothetical protein n=1 Tax=Dactylosporangium sp. CA-139066 TaxID=3239930 RepID=UPI003D8D2B17